MGPILLTWIDLIPSCISDYIRYKWWDKIAYRFLKLNDATVEV